MTLSIVIGCVTNCLLAQESTIKQQLTIDRLFELIELNSKTLTVQKSGTDIAQQALLSAKSDRLPDIDTQLSMSYLGNGFTTKRNFTDFTQAPIPHFGNNFVLEASQVIYSGGAISNNIQLSQLVYQQSQIAVQRSREQLRFLLLSQYLDLFKLDNQIKVYNQNIALTDKLIEQVHAKQEQGAALKNDVTRYELQKKELELSLLKLNNLRLVQNHQLCTSLSIPYTTCIEPDTTLIDKLYAQDGEEYWQTHASVTSPAIKQAAITIDMAKTKVKIAQSDLLPKISLVAADHFDGPITIEVPPINRNFNYWYLGVGIKYSLSSLFKSNKRISQAKYAVNQSQISKSAVADEVSNAVQEGYVLYMQSYSDWHTQQKSVELARQNYVIVNERYLNQLALITDMLDASNIRLSAELQEVNARISIVYNYYKMKYLSGTL